MSKNSKLALLRTAACKAWPRAAYAILSMKAIERPGLQTMAVDQHWRLYFDPDWIEQETNDKLVGVILHEVSHLLLRHHKRASQVVKDTAEDWNLWNIAADAAINPMVKACGAVLPDGVVMPRTLELPENKSAEFYYRELCRRRDQEKENQQPDPSPPEQDDEPDDGDDEQPETDQGDSPEDDGQESDDTGDSDQSDDDSDQGDDTEQPGESEDPCDQDQPGEGDQPGDGTQPEPGDDGDQPGNEPSDQPGDGAGDQQGSGSGMGDSEPEDVDDWDGSPAEGQMGSCSDGQKRPWELPDPEPDDDTVLDEFDQADIIKQVAESIESHGTENGYLKSFCDEVLRPKVDPKRLLMSAIRRHTDNIVSGGDGKYSYRRPSRRPSTGGMIRPRSFQVIPKIKILIDTSGSMGKTDFMRGMGLVAKCLSSLPCRDGINVVTGDTREAWAGKVFDHSKIELCGGGGTDMDKILTSLDELDDKTDLIICITDGITPWPQKKLKTPIVVCLTREESNYSFYKVPDWIKKVEI